MLDAMDAIVSDLEEMSDAALQAKFDAFEAGAIGYAISGAEPFVTDFLNSFFSAYRVSRKNLRIYVKSNMGDLAYFNDYVQSANDDSYQIAA